MIALFSLALLFAHPAFGEEEPRLVPRIFLETFSLPQPRGEIRAVYPRGIELTASMEGFRERLYSDPAGYCTIGFGHLVKRAPCDGSEPARYLAGLDRAAALALLRDDMGLAEAAVSALAPVALSDGQYAALCDFTFNVGRGRLARSQLLEYVNAGAFEKVPAQLRRYVLANGRRLEGLVIRREKEIELFFEGLPIPRALPGPGEDLTPIDIALPESGDL